jgi:hypothetical protein
MRLAQQPNPDRQALGIAQLLLHPAEGAQRARDLIDVVVVADFQARLLVEQAGQRGLTTFDLRCSLSRWRSRLSAQSPRRVCWNRCCCRCRAGRRCSSPSSAPCRRCGARSYVEGRRQAGLCPRDQGPWPVWDGAQVRCFAAKLAVRVVSPALHGIAQSRCRELGQRHHAVESCKQATHVPVFLPLFAPACARCRFLSALGARRQRALRVRNHREALAVVSALIGNSSVEEMRV